MRSLLGLEISMSRSSLGLKNFKVSEPLDVKMSSLGYRLGFENKSLVVTSPRIMHISLLFYICLLTLTSPRYKYSPCRNPPENE